MRIWKKDKFFIRILYEFITKFNHSEKGGVRGELLQER